MPSTGTPLQPPPELAGWRAQCPATGLSYPDGHEGWLITGYEMAKKILEDSRFSQQPHRFPGPPPENPWESLWGVDEEAERSGDVDLLSVDRDAHQYARRLLLPFFSMKAVRGYQEKVEAVVAHYLEHFEAQGSPADLTEHFAEPISAVMHAYVLGIPDDDFDEWYRLFVHQAPAVDRVAFMRRVVDKKPDHLGHDLLSSLIEQGIPREHIVGLFGVVSLSGRDSVAYMISTSTHALLNHPQQWAALRDDPELMSPAIEELVRYGTLFLGLFPRTATEDVEHDGIRIQAGQSVTVSAVAANRDPERFTDPDQLDIHRDARGHVGFGHGLHSCVGQQMGRLEIRTALAALMRRFPDLLLEHADQAEPTEFYHPVPVYRVGRVIVAWD